MKLSCTHIEGSPELQECMRIAGDQIHYCPCCGCYLYDGLKEKRQIKFRKKPIIVEAEQWFPHMGESLGIVYLPSTEIGRKPMIKTLEGWYEVTAGDFIITGVKGEKYPCKPDIFKLTYEKFE